MNGALSFDQVRADQQRRCSLKFCRLNHFLAAIGSISWPTAVANSFPGNDDLDEFCALRKHKLARSDKWKHEMARSEIRVPKERP